jgi:uncharacterized YigZ family protein
MADSGAWQFLTPRAPSHAEIKEQGSRFVAHLVHAGTEDQAMTFLDGLRRRYHDATHHCWAYRLGWADGLRFRFSDDGEPSHTAGTPILGTLEERGVSDVCLVVVRYFGGVKLGTGGLARAYRAAARAVLDEADLELEILCEEMEVVLPYGAQGSLRHACAKMGVELNEEDYGDKLTLSARVPRAVREPFLSSLVKLKDTWKGEVRWRSR